MLRPYLATGVAITGASLITVTPVAPPPDVQVRAIQLTSGDTADSPLGDGIALGMGGTGSPLPPQTGLDAVETLYLEPRGFTGTVQALFTPEALYPATGVKSLPFDTSVAQGAQILDTAIQQQIAGGGVDAANPVVVFGYSQSSTVASQAMHQLADQGVPSDDVHFVLVGDPSNPDGGVLERFDFPAGTSPSVPSLGITFSGATPADLYPTDIYTNEYDGFADFPRYPLNFLSDLNAFLGLAFQHGTYLDLAPEQIQNAIQLPTSAADTLTNYYMIPAETLPLLAPLQVLPVIGTPLYDLLEPDMRILVNLGYGSITDGWDPGPADVPTPFGLWPTNIDPTELFTALATGLQQGITDAIKDLQDPATYQITPSFFLDNPLVTQLVNVAHTGGLTDATNPSEFFNLSSLLDLARNALLDNLNFPISDATLLSSPTEILNDLTGTVSADYASLLPIADTVTTLLTTLPAYDASIFTDQLEAGNLLGAIGLPIAADIALVPSLLGVGAGAPILESVGGTLLNLVDLIPGI
jgi:hypothetical protein